MENNINIILTRHGRYDKTEDIETAGHITEQGKKEIEQKTKERIKNIVGKNLLNTTFLVIGSPTHWLSKEYFGQRAKETEQITKQTIVEILKQQGVEAEEISKYMYSKNEIYTRKSVIPIREIANLIAEPNVYDEAPEYIKKLKLKHGGMTDGFWEELTTSEEAKQYNENAETPSVLNRKIKNMLNYVIDWSKTYSKENKKDVCVILISHGETMDPFLNSSKLRGELGDIDYNEGIIFEIKESQIIVKTENPKFIGPSKPLKIKEDEIEVR